MTQYPIELGDESFNYDEEILIDWFKVLTGTTSTSNNGLDNSISSVSVSINGRGQFNVLFSQATKFTVEKDKIYCLRLLHAGDLYLFRFVISDCRM